MPGFFKDNNSSVATVNILPIKLCKTLLGYLLLPLLSALTDETEYSFQSIFLCVYLKEKVNIACHSLIHV